VRGGEALQEDRRPDGDHWQAGPRERLLAEPVLPLLRLGVVFWMLIWETVIWDMLTKAFTPTSRRTAAMVTVASRYPGGHGHAEVDPPTAADDPIDVGRFDRSPTTTSAPADRKAAARSSSRRTMARTGSPRSRSRPVTVSPIAPS
jgi:hypothetical protein